MGTAELKIPWRYPDLLNQEVFSEGVKFVYIFSEKCFRVGRDDLNNVPMKGLYSKPMRIHLETNNDIYM